MAALNTPLWKSTPVAGLLLALSACGGNPVSPTPPPGLDQAVMQQAQQLGPHQLMGDILRAATYDEDESASWNVNLEMSKCYAFAAAGDPNVYEMKLYLFNGQEQRVATSEPKSNRLKTTFCVTGGVVGVTYGPWGTGGVATATPGLYRVEIKTKEGNGHIALGIFVKTDGAGPPPPPTPADAPPADAPPADAPPPAEPAPPE